MPFRRRRRMRMMRAPITSFRQIGDLGLSMVGSATENTVIGTARTTDVVGFTNTVVAVGSKISRIRIVINAHGAGGADSGFLDWYLCKARGAQNVTTEFPSATAMGNSDVRNQIFYTQYDAYTSQDGGTYKHDRWVKIPKLYQRMRDGDNFIIKFRNNSTSNLEYSLHYDYKAYT